MSYFSLLGFWLSTSIPSNVTGVRKILLWRKEGGYIRLCSFAEVFEGWRRPLSQLSNNLSPVNLITASEHCSSWLPRDSWYERILFFLMVLECSASRTLSISKLTFLCQLLFSKLLTSWKWIQDLVSSRMICTLHKNDYIQDVLHAKIKYPTQTV